ncbi:Retrovirus-related Pol polyprotein from transposon TNT 1-94 [Vitis vinifera]|uniref:Retrovirus-related Pol polyprotein from transposon TNT 1-94 n=1 Tax=Vitis vinifera TaxID=29760 RepID=A0A438EEX7_VITVI|nr:Retrovirus-related Pol polyprotein from transposon TNT 1-94 [Vitis vinifera]
MDVKTAFLNGYLEEEIYMDQPKGCVVPEKKKKVCKLVKSLYGLKQAPKQWHNKFDHVFVTNGYSINDTDKCIYSKYEDNTYVVIYLYVDDMLIFGTSLEVLCETKKFLGSKFDMKDLGELEKSAKQTSITRSIMEVEFIALENESSKAEWLRNFLADISLWMKPIPSVSMHCDSQATIAKAKKVISLEIVRSELNLVDPLTKPLNKKLVEETSRRMRLMPITELKSGDRVYSALIKVECLLLMNTIFLMDGAFRYTTATANWTITCAGDKETSRQSRRAPLASQTCIAGELDAHREQAKRAPWASQTGTKQAPLAHQASTMRTLGICDSRGHHGKALTAPREHHDMTLAVPRTHEWHSSITHGLHDIRFDGAYAWHNDTMPYAPRMNNHGCNAMARCYGVGLDNGS